VNRSALALALVLALSSPASAQAPSAVNEAQTHFKRGVELYEDGDLPAALVEFRRAYDLVPNHRVLYNLGRVASAQHDYASALRFYRQYLSDGGAQVAAQRRQEVDAEIQKLAGRVGQLRVIVDLVGAEISVDDLSVGISPLPAPVLVNAGRRRVVAAAPNHPPVARVVEVAGEETVTATLALPVPRPAPVVPAIPEPRPVVRERPRPAPPPAPPRRRWPAVLGWTTTGLLAAGAATTGVLALSSARDLQQRRDAYPASLEELEWAQRKTRRLALIADGLLAGTAVCAALSLYLSFSGPGESTVAVGPGSVSLARRF
jgi:tetratricopeptide (TPR) repeat protein